MQIEVACKNCGGSGKTAIDESLSETLELIPPKRGATAIELSERLPRVKATAFNNRLERLRALGLLRRERHGKFYRYFRV